MAKKRAHEPVAVGKQLEPAEKLASAMVLKNKGLFMLLESTMDRA